MPTSTLRLGVHADGSTTEHVRHLLLPEGFEGEATKISEVIDRAYKLYTNEPERWVQNRQFYGFGDETPYGPKFQCCITGAITATTIGLVQKKNWDGELVWRTRDSSRGFQPSEQASELNSATTMFLNSLAAAYSGRSDLTLVSSWNDVVGRRPPQVCAFLARAQRMAELAERHS